MDSKINLTEREKEVLQLMSEGLTAEEMGGRLYISSRTVEFHQARIREKTGTRNRIEVLMAATALGIL